MDVTRACWGWPQLLGIQIVCTFASSFRPVGNREETEADNVKWWKLFSKLSLKDVGTCVWKD
eukprot:4284928-Amphidinium_carterae.1